MAITLDGTNGITTETGTGDVSVGDDLIFTGTSNRITGDMSNATHANRVAFQSSTINGPTSPFFIPNGTGNIASVVVANASDPTNSSFGQLAVIGTTEVRVLSGLLGTGTYLPMAFYTGGSERMRIDTSGNLLFNSGYGSVATAYGCRAWVNFDGTSNSANQTGTYSQTGTTVTVSITAHGYATGQEAFLDFTSGTAVDGVYSVTVVDADTFTVTQASRTTSGNVTNRRNPIRASGNVSSISDNGAGDYTVNFTTAMPDTNYCVSSTVGPVTQSATISGVRVRDSSAITTSGVRINVNLTSATVLGDPSSCHIAIFR